MRIYLWIVLLTVALTLKPPTSICRVSPLPSQIPITIGEELRFDLQAVFSGYNLFFNASASPHITVAEKYVVTEKPYGSSYNFISTKIKAQNLFLGLVSRGDYSGIAVGVNDQTSGVTIEYYVQVEDIPNLHCFDVDSINYQNGSLAVVDCAFFHMGENAYNEFLYINLTSGELIKGSHFSDSFVAYNSVTKRKIQIYEDPFTRVPYLLRFNLRDGVDQGHRDQTYAEIFLMINPLRPQILDVIDHTFFDIPKLSIADYQVFAGSIFILAYNRALYEVELDQNQYVFIRSKFDIKLDINRFHIDRLNFNDDLQVVATNGNTVYQFQWDLLYPPTQVAKYTLIPNSEVEQIFVDFNFVIVLAWSRIDNERVRRTWVFSRRTLSYLNAYNVFHSPDTGPVIIHWNQHGTILQIFQQFTSFNVKLNLPYLDVKPVSQSMTEEYTVVATSRGDAGQSTKCTQKFIFVYLARNDTRVIKTGFWPLEQAYVDSPGAVYVPLAYQFFGANLTYKVEFSSDSAIIPYQYVDKQHKATIQWPEDIDVSSIVYFQMFSQTTTFDERAKSIYGLLQTAQRTPQKTIYTSHYVRCLINVFDRDETHSLQCRPINTFRFSVDGRIIAASTIVDPRQHLIAVVFDLQPHIIMLYTLSPSEIMLYGRKDYSGDPANQVTGLAVAGQNLYVVLEYGKRIEVFHLGDLYLPEDKVNDVRPKLIINSQVSRFFGVPYFAPVNLKVCRFHPGVIFVKTKVGLIAISVNYQFFPEFLFNIKTNNILYDFQINQNHVLIIDEKATTVYELQNPLRRTDAPLVRQSIPSSFKLGQYDEVSSDRLFYIVGSHSVYVVNPRYRSTTAVYADVWVADPILSVDAVNIFNKEMLFIRTAKQIIAWVFAEDPTLYVEWPMGSRDFTMKLSASSRTVTSEPYSLLFSILDTNETVIKPTAAFNETFVRQLGKTKVGKSNKTFSKTISLNDSEWFEGNVLRYHLNCSHCGQKVSLQNHVQQTRQIVEGRAIYDIESTIDGIYGQQYYSLLRTNTFNDSISFINMIPTGRLGEVCSKIAVGNQQHYVLSLCELGTSVNVYVTSLVANKPFTFGPYPTQAKAVNHAKLVGDILMIVDNDDDPFLRAGGIYIYQLDLDFDSPDFLNFLDYLDYQDLQFEGFSGVPYIGSADLHQPDGQGDPQYRLFLTEARSGAIFIFSFEVSPDGQEVIYVSKKYIELAKFIPKELKYPSPLRVQSIKIHFEFEAADRKRDYYLLLSVANWHHMELLITLNQNDDILAFKLERLFERFPWQLGNYLEFKQGRFYNTLFAVPYVNPDAPSQIVAIYSVPYIINMEAASYEQKYAAHEYTMLGGLVPVVRMFGAHLVRDNNEVAFAFNIFGNDKLLFTDVDGYNITELTLNKNITLTVTNLEVDKEQVKIIASNPYTNYTFQVNLQFLKDKDDDDDDDEKEKEKEKEKQQILWIAVVSIATIMIVGLLIAWIKQNKTIREQAARDAREGRETVLTLDDQVRNYGLNRSSVDPDSVRGSIETPLVQDNVKTTLRNEQVEQNRLQK